eukprot:XP_002609170.1 hypothetical protein BRAFLDRAFT_92539 [Branchiostoma floridae]
MSAAYTTPLRTRPDENSIKNCLKPDFRYAGTGSKHAGWTGAGLAVGAGVLFGAGLYKTTLHNKSPTKEPVDDGDAVEKTGLNQVVTVDKSPVGVLTRAGATSSSAAGLQSGTTVEADVKVNNRKDPAEETEKDAENEVPTKVGEVDRSSQEDQCADDSNLSSMTSHAILAALPKNDRLYPAKPPQQPQLQLHGDHIWIRFLMYLLIYMGYVKILPARYSAQAASTYGRTAAERFGSRSPQGGASRGSTRRQRPWT